jgi:hypothetical protein
MTKQELPILDNQQLLAKILQLEARVTKLEKKEK